MTGSSEKTATPFVWGVSTSAYQIEGAWNEDGRGPSIWDTWSQQPGNVSLDANGNVACDHYHRFAGDLKLAAGLGVNAYRFSVSWSRVLPDGHGKANPKGLDFYERLADRCLALGMTPWLCLYHWDLPQSLQDKGGWAQRDIAAHFADYAGLIARRLGDRVRHFSTFNEMTISCLYGHLLGCNAPGIRDRDTYLRAMHFGNLAHGLASQAIRSASPRSLIGNIHTLQPVYAATASSADTDAAVVLDAHWNRAYADPQVLGSYPARLQEWLEPIIRTGDLALIRQPLDWLGVNHYSPLYARADTAAPFGFSMSPPPPGSECSDIGWPVSPEDFYRTLVDTSNRYALPVYVTENGYGSLDEGCTGQQLQDQRRVDYLRRYIAALEDARHQGANIAGYFVWSLLDNFEWAFGYTQRFGLYHVDFVSQKRTPKASAHWYGTHIRESRE